ncbi:hypothetical protein RYA05_01795 [Pseudomonas syringae pv. actinidiae]|nr:hypothetical protein [Pseudomonas syringae pv. actinidiae]
MLIPQTLGIIAYAAISAAELASLLDYEKVKSGAKYKNSRRLYQVKASWIFDEYHKKLSAKKPSSPLFRGLHLHKLKALRSKLKAQREILRHPEGDFEGVPVYISR